MGLMKLKGIRRVNTFTDPELLGEDEVTRLENLILDGGIAKKRGGIQSYNTSSPGGSLTNLFELDGNIYGLVDIGSTRVLKRTTGGAWGLVKVNLSDLPMRFVRYRDKGYFTNGTDNIVVVEGTTARGFYIASPVLTSTTASLTASTSLEDTKWYSYRMSYVTSSGEESAFSPALAIQTDSTNRAVSFTGLPVSGDTRVTSRKLYRTEGSGGQFYLAATLDNVDTTYTDSMADDDLDTSETLTYIAEVEKADVMCVHKDRMILGGITTNNAVLVQPYRLFAEESTAGNLNGTYTYAVSYTMANGRETAITATSTITVSSKRVSIGYGPNRSYDASDVAKINLYRTNSGGSTYYLIQSSTDKSGTVVDNTLTLSSSTFPADSSDSYEEEINSSRVYFSDIDKPQQVPTLNYIDVYPDDDEEIMGLVDQADGILVLKEKSICMIYTSGSPYNWRVVKLIENVGCTDTNSIQRAVNSVYFRYQNDIYRYPDMKAISREFRDTLDGITIEDTTYVSKHGWYVIVGSSCLYIYDEKNDTWLYFLPSDIPFASAIETVDGIFLLGKEILTYYDESETLDYDDSEASNTAEISTTLRSKTFTVGTPTQGFRLRKLYSNFTQGSSNVIQSLTDPQTGDARSVTTSDSGEINYRGITDSFTGNLETAHKFYYQISGDLAEFNGMEVEGIMRHRRRTWS